MEYHNTNHLVVEPKEPTVIHPVVVSWFFRQENYQKFPMEPMDMESMESITEYTLNIDKIDWKLLSNPNAIHLLEKNQDKEEEEDEDEDEEE